MAKKKVIGKCHICGLHTQLTFEHVPPRAAFNDRPVINTPFDKIVNTDDLDDLSNLKGKQSQRGAGGYTLCVKCNNDTGAWYGNAFVSWSYQGYHISKYASVAPSIYHLFHIFPLRVIKQIVCMFFSANHPGFSDVQSELVRFVLNRNRKYLDPDIRFYTYFNISDRSRQSGVTGSMSIGQGGHKVFSEISFPPFGYVMSLGTPPPDERLLDISHFSSYSFNDWADVSLRIPVLPVYTWVPGDFRGREEVISSMSKNAL